MTSPSPSHLSSSIPIPTSGNVLSGFEPLEPIIPDEQPDVTPFERLIPNFVSKHVRQYVDHLVSENKLSNAKPIALEGFAAVVMADVSGYSTLTSFLADRGPDGTEILSRIMKEYVDKIIQIISLHGGDIVKFVGDAVLFYWSLNDKPGTPIENDPRRKGFLVIKACECCLDLLKKLKNYQVVIPPSSKDKNGQPTTKELKIHLGVGAGRIFDVHVGGEPGRWEHFIVGDAMEQLATVLDLAKAGQLAVSKRAFELIRNLVHVGMLDFDSFDTKKCYILNKFDRSALKFPEENYNTDVLDLEASIFSPPTLTSALTLPLSKSTSMPRNKPFIKKRDENNEFLSLWEIQSTASLSSRNFEHYKLYVNESALFKLESDIKSSSPFQLNQGVSHLMSLNELRQVTTVFIKVGSLSFKEVEEIDEEMAEQATYIVEQESILHDKERQLVKEIEKLASKEVQDMYNSEIEDHKKRLEQSKQVYDNIKKQRDKKLKEALAKCQRAMTLVQVALRRHEGILRQFHVDDKGAIILAFFGLPPLSHNNDALQGIQAGLEICEGFNKEDADFSVGITTGVISIGGVGNSLRTEYALMGDSINMAARLMCLKAAENSIICDERSYLLCQREFDFDHLGQTTVKGKTQPISIFLPLKRRPDAEQNSKMLELAMLGRQNEKKLVNELFERHVKQSHTFCKVIVEGDGGQGVATFGKYIKTTAEGLDYCICSARITETERSSPYTSYRTIVRELVKLLDRTTKTDDNAWRLTNANTLALTFRGSMNMPRHTSHGNNLNPHSTQSSNESVAPINGRISSGRSHNSLYFGSFIFSPTAGSKKEKEETGNGKKEGDQCSELEQQIRRCLVKLKENPNLASLFSVMFPNEVKPDSDLSLQGVSRQKEITDILRNMINILTDNHKLLIYLPEAQWMDSISWQITSDIIETCPRALFCLLSRPATHYANEHDLAIYEEIQQKISTTTIKLRGLTEQEITELIIETWNNLAVQAATAYPNQGDSLARQSSSAGHAPSPLSMSMSSPFSNGSSSNYASAVRPRRISNGHFLNGDPDTECQLIRHVDQAVSSKIFKISGGNPLFAKSLIMTLRDRRLHSITADGKLIVPSDFDFDKIVPGSDLHSIIVSQFDRLDFMFQVFLKIASVLGQKFSLDDVLHFMLYENYSDSPKPVHQTVLRKQPQQLVKDIEQMDKYSFLTRIEEKDDDDNAGIWFSFKNSVIRESIYTTMLIAQKQKLHLSMAVYFESRMNHLNRHRLLIRIFEHYQQTDNSHIDKKLYYLEQICHLYFENNAMNEAISHYNDLLNMVQIKEDQTGKVLYDNVEKAKWHKELGDAYFASENLSLAEENLKKALALLNFYLPEPGVSLQIRTKLQLLQLKRNQARSTAKSAPSDPQRRIVHITRTVLASLSDVYAQMEKLEYWRYTTYCAQNLSEYLARDTTYAAFLAKAAYAMFTTRVNSSYAAKYIDFAMWILERDQTPVLSNTLMIKEYTALITLLSGNWTQAAGKLNELMTECSKVGDLMKAERSMRLLLFVQFLQGNHNECKLLAIDLWNKSKEKNSWHGQFWCLVFTFLFDISLSASFSSREDMTYLNELVKKRFAALVEEADNTSKDGLYLYLTFQAINAEYDYRTRQDNSARFRNVMVRLRRLKAYHWQSLISIFIFLNLIFIAYDNDEVDMLAKNLGGTKVIVSFLQMVAKQMDKMWQITLAGQLKLVAQGLVFLVQDQKDKALAIWKRGLNQTKLWGNLSIVPAVSVQMEETSHNGTKPSFSSSVSPLPSQTNASHLLPTSSLPSFMVARDPGISTNPQYSNRFYHSDGFISAYLRHKLAKHGDTSLLNESIISTSSSLAVPKGSRPADLDAQDNHIAATAFTGSKQLQSGRVR